MNPSLASKEHFWLVAGGPALLVCLGPLHLLMQRLIKAKRRSLHEYSTLRITHNQLFDGKWVQGRNPKGDPVLGAPEISSLADFGSAYRVLERMRPEAKTSVPPVRGECRGKKTKKVISNRVIKNRGEMKLPGHRPGLPGKVIAFHIVPPVVGSNRLDPAYKAGLAGHIPVKREKWRVTGKNGKH